MIKFQTFQNTKIQQKILRTKTLLFNLECATEGRKVCFCVCVWGGKLHREMNGRMKEQTDGNLHTYITLQKQARQKVTIQILNYIQVN